MNIEHLRTALHLIIFLAQFCFLVILVTNVLLPRKEYIEDSHSIVKWFLGI